METIRFEDLELDAKIMRAITDMGFEAASPIQGQAIPLELQGLDIIGQAQTGTGKTAAFGIPLLQKIDPKNKKPQAIILCPTRELAIQVSEEIRRLAKYMHGVKVLPIYGGQEIGRQIRSLKDGVQVIIGTPGRVMDHMRRKTVKMDQIHTVVLDEADEMLNMGFLEDMETILSALPEERQTLMFSATMPQAIQRIAANFQKDPQIVRVVKKELTVPKVTQYYYEVKPKNKLEVMCRLLDLYDPKLSVVFCNTKKQVDVHLFPLGSALGLLRCPAAGRCGAGLLGAAHPAVHPERCTGADGQRCDEQDEQQFNKSDPHGGLPSSGQKQMGIRIVSV